MAAEPNPFPAICGRVCTAPCEDVCRRGEFDAPIAIRDLKRFATDHRLPRQAHGHATEAALCREGRHRWRRTNRIERSLLSGATRLSGVTVFDAMPVAGGMMAIGIPEYRLPRVELNRDIDAISALGVEFRLNTAIGRDVTLTSCSRTIDAVLLAVGAQRSQRLDVPGEDCVGSFPPRHSSRSSTWNRRRASEAIVAVVGGGSTAMDAARSALRAGAQQGTYPLPPYTGGDARAGRGGARGARRGHRHSTS